MAGADTGDALAQLLGTSCVRLPAHYGGTLTRETWRNEQGQNRP